jgi:hypothetical protein
MHDITQQNDISPDSYLEPRRPPRLRSAALVTAGILAVGVAVAACGGGPSTPSAATGSTTTTPASSSAGGKTDSTGLVAYSSCMRSHGVPNFPDPASSGGIPKAGVISAEGAVSSAQVNAASNACEHLLPAGGSLSGQPSQTITAQDEQDYLKAAACLRSHGITNFPDPTFSDGTVHFDIPASIDTHSTQFTQAQQICQKLIPAGLPGSGG